MLQAFFTQRIAMGIVRHALTTIGGALVASGTLDPSQVEVLTGAGVALAGIGWSVWEKRF
jgi:hypothetical protein